MGNSVKTKQKCEVCCRLFCQDQSYHLTQYSESACSNKLSKMKTLKIAACSYCYVYFCVLVDEKMRHSAGCKFSVASAGKPCVLPFV